MSDTPRTDDVARMPTDLYPNWVVDVSFARALERENAELRADKARLDWLDRNAHIRDRTLAVMERDGETLRWAGVEWDGTEETVRAAIDEARNQP